MKSLNHLRYFRALPIFAAIAAALLLVSCSDSPGVRLRYQAEKKLFEAEREARTASIQPQTMTPATMERLQKKYGEVLDFCYLALDSLPSNQYQKQRSELSQIAFRSASRVAQVFFRNGQYDTCVAIMNRLLSQTDVYGASKISTYLNLGQALQAAGKWDSALTVFHYSIDTFYPPVDGQGKVIYDLFNLPAHIFSVYIQTGDTIAAKIQLDNAEYYYRDIAKENPGTELERAAHSTLTNLYENSGRWKDAIAQLQMITDSLGQIMPVAKQRMADIYASRLNQPDTAILIYDDLMNELVGKDTLAIPLIMFKKGQAMVDEKKYDGARSIMIDVKRDYPRFFNANPDVQSGIARTFELEGNWDRAETEYKFLIEKYDNSEEAMDTYLYLIGWYEHHNRKAEAKRMTERAAAAFDRVAANNPGTRLEASALAHKAELFRQEKDWPMTAQALMDTFDKFPRTDIGYQAAVAASVVYREKLNQPEVADSVLSELRNRLTTVDERPEI